MSKSLDVTDRVKFDNPDDESLPIKECACGAKFEAWDFIISVYEEWPTACPSCGMKLYFRNTVRVFEVLP